MTTSNNIAWKERDILWKVRDHYKELCNALSDTYHKKIKEEEKKECTHSWGSSSDSEEWTRQAEEAHFNNEKEKKIKELKKELEEKKEAVLEETDWRAYIKNDLDATSEIDVVKTSTGPVIFNRRLFLHIPDRTGNSFDTFLFTSCEKGEEIILPRYVKDGSAYQNLNSLFMDAILPEGVTFASESMDNVKNIDKMFYGVKNATPLNFPFWSGLNVKAVDEQTNQIITGAYTEITESDIILSPETEEWFNNGSAGDPPASYYTDALTSFRNGAKKLMEGYEKGTGKRFWMYEDHINFEKGLSVILNKFPDFRIVWTEQGNVVYSENLYKHNYSIPFEGPTVFNKKEDVEEFPIKPHILEKDEEYSNTQGDEETVEEEEADEENTHKKVKCESEIDDSNIFNLRLRNLC